MTPDEQNELREQLEIARKRYYDIYALVQRVGLSGVINLASTKCIPGETCTTGEHAVKNEDLLKKLISSFEDGS